MSWGSSGSSGSAGSSDSESSKYKAEDPNILINKKMKESLKYFEVPRGMRICEVIY